MKIILEEQSKEKQNSEPATQHITKSLAPRAREEQIDSTISKVDAQVDTQGEKEIFGMADTPKVAEKVEDSSPPVQVDSAIVTLTKQLTSRVADANVLQMISSIKPRSM